MTRWWEYVIGGLVGLVFSAGVISLAHRLPPRTAFGGPSQERDSIVARAARQAGMPEALAIAVSHVENWGGDSTARHPISGATGLMQVMPRLWADSFRTECGTDSLVGRWRNACVGTHVAARYFAECGNWDCALRRYAGAWCTPTDSWERCHKKQQAGDAYVLDVVRRFGRSDLSPARDQMAAGTSWRRDDTP